MSAYRNSLSERWVSRLLADKASSSVVSKVVIKRLFAIIGTAQLPVITEVAPTGVGISKAKASGSLPAISMVASSASGLPKGKAAGNLTSISETVPSSSALPKAKASASVDSSALSAPSATASTGSGSVSGTGTGAIAQVSLTAPSGIGFAPLKLKAAEWIIAGARNTSLIRDPISQEIHHIGRTSWVDYDYIAHSGVTSNPRLTEVTFNASDIA